jgi:lipopolysaccharide transport system ATP-binding protein
LSDAMISAENVSKRYTLRRHNAHDRLLAASIIGMASRAVQRPKDPEQNEDIHWALRDVSFEVRRGEAMGIIGRNGAGKSTLLKIISRLTRPTKGRVVTRGRIGSMLEVGVGFNPELTGRENVMLSGVILGISRSDIRKKFESIVEFSGIRPFIEVPVKRYSSGMRIRLAFAVMVMLEPEVLLIDEVLSVGDAEFKRRSADRMHELIRSGRTVLFVSHNRTIVEQLCDRAMELDRGRLVSIGATSKVVDHYATMDVEPLTESNAYASFESEAEKTACIREIAVLTADGNCSGEIELADSMRVRIGYDLNEDVSGAHVFCRVETPDGVTVLGSGDADYDPSHLGLRRRGSYSTEFQIESGLIEAGSYRLSVSIGVPYEKNMDRRVDVVQFRIVDRSSRRRAWYQQTRPGLVGREFPWIYEGRPPFA